MVEDRVWRQSAAIPQIRFCETACGYSGDEIGAEAKRLAQVEPWTKLFSVSGAWRTAAQVLDGIAKLLREQGQALVGKWESQDAAAAQRSLQRMEGTARHLASVSRKLATFTEDSAETLRCHISRFPSVEWYEFWEWGTAEQQNREALDALNSAYRRINSESLPSEVCVELPIVGDASTRDFTNAGGGLGGGSGLSLPSRQPDLDLSGPRSNGSTGSSGAAGGSWPDQPATGLAGAGDGLLSGVGGSQAGGFRGGIGSGGIGSPNTGPGGPALGPAGSAGAVVPGGLADGLGARVASAPATGAAMMPMGAGGMAGNAQDRERESWLVEDEDPWSDGVDATPPVIS